MPVLHSQLILLLVVLELLMLLAGVASTAHPSATPPNKHKSAPMKSSAAGPTGTYIVLLDKQPAATTEHFKKRRSADPATARAATAAFEAYEQQLLRDQAAVLASVTGSTSAASGSPAPRMIQQYTVTSNGFAVTGLTKAQADALMRNPLVMSVTPDKIVSIPEKPQAAGGGASSSRGASTAVMPRGGDGGV